MKMDELISVVTFKWGFVRRRDLRMCQSFRRVHCAKELRLIF
ncbi:hypothetical protein KPSA3_04423 [Pseudomonas syringae pv. actinidiae]|uniref:Uncharacterized protein n=1 Tax=Pseudomonas syringae pv. actinidiae TaxID=103796 RepID=A0AAN4TMQ9_PSESF|nr:hypothetical protein KPSA3_04423 [Pseudomonas syringae pv. actinidiae]